METELPRRPYFQEVAEHFGWLTKQALAINSKNTFEDKPYRDRVELYAVSPEGQVLSGLYPKDRTPGVPGGGVDPGETPEEAAAREYLEETGRRITDVRLLPVEPFTQDWSPPYKTPKQEARARQFRGSRTHYATGKLTSDDPTKPVDSSGLKYFRLRRLRTLVNRLEKGHTDPEAAARVASRLQAVRSLEELLKSGDDRHVPTIAVDLDGTLAENLREFDSEKIGPPRQGARKWMRKFQDAGARIVIFTVRGNRELIRKWLEEHRIPFDSIGENPDQPEDSSGKVLADIYFDDRAIDASQPLSQAGQEALERLKELG